MHFIVTFLLSYICHCSLIIFTSQCPSLPPFLILLVPSLCFDVTCIALAFIAIPPPLLFTHLSLLSWSSCLEDWRLSLVCTQTRGVVRTCVLLSFLLLMLVLNLIGLPCLPTQSGFRSIPYLCSKSLSRPYLALQCVLDSFPFLPRLHPERR